RSDLLSNMSRKQEVAKIEIPDFVVDTGTKKKYIKGKFLGRGGFAKCYELIEKPGDVVFAGKVIAKAQLQKSDQKEKMSQEIAIHRSIKHKHIVQFNSYFEDKNFIYIVLELCSKRSLMEMHKRRKTLTEPEIRYFVRQIADACLYLHERKIVHRDLKLGNLFLNEVMELKVGDFGLATRIVSEGERKLTLCGTPNYIAPEVLMKKGHSYEVDVWSLGCIVYTLIVGKPPFETSELKDTYKRIRHNEYHIPSFVPHEVRVFIQKMLQSDPKQRPSMRQVLNDNYMKNYIPSKLPQSCLTMPPHYNEGRLSIMPTEILLSPRRPLVDVNVEQNAAVKVEAKPKKGEDIQPSRSRENYNLNDLKDQLCKLIDSKPEFRRPVNDDEAEDPASTPIFWISKWVDYTDRYGIGYQLCDNSIGILFNDVTRISLLADGHNLQYIEKNNTEHFHTIENHPQNLFKKVTLLKYFRNYMNDHLLKTGEKPQTQDVDEITRLPHLNNWFRTRTAIVFQLTNGIVQINFFGDHTKLILCPHMGAVTYIDENRDFRTYRFSLIEKYGVNKNVAERLRYARDVVNKLMVNKLSVNTKSSNRT
ncbi:serine/threonine-protein kinase PLK1-like protein, partial [Leptotrombidium deliense]